MEKLTFEVIERIAKNDPKAMQLLKKSGLQMEIMKSAWNRKRLNSTEATDFFKEVCGEVIKTYFNKKNQLSPEEFAIYLTQMGGGNIKKFFQTTANNHLPKFVKDQRSPYKSLDDSVQLQVADEAKLPYEEIILDKRILIMNQCMHQLGAECRELIKDIHMYDRSADDLAEENSKTAGAIRTALSRCMKQLHHLIELHGLTVKKGK